MFIQGLWFKQCISVFFDLIACLKLSKWLVSTLFISLHINVPLFKYRPHTVQAERIKPCHHISAHSPIPSIIHLSNKLGTCHGQGTMLGTWIHAGMNLWSGANVALALMEDSKSHNHTNTFSFLTKQTNKGSYCIGLCFLIPKNLELLALGLLFSCVTGDSVKRCHLSLIFKIHSTPFIELFIRRCLKALYNFYF